MKEKKPLMFRFTSWWVSKVYRGYNKLELSEDNGVYVSNHCLYHGPLYYQLYFPKPKKIWVIYAMCNRKEAIDYSYEEFLHLKKPRWFFILISRIIARLLSFFIIHAETIPVYKDLRISSTLKESVRALKNNENLVIMPECHQEYNEVLHEFQKNYIELARLYYKMTKKRLKFYPTYLAPKIRKICVGEPIEFNPEAEIEFEKTRINQYLKDEITKMYFELPRHKVVLYD